MADEIGPGSLKSVTGLSPERSLRALIEAELAQHVRADDIRHLLHDTFLAYTEADTATIRDWLAPLMEEGEAVFVVEFERWSGCGPMPDRDWLRRRGH